MIVIILGGLIVGSFFNALVFRIGHNESIVHGRSKCPHCEKTIAWYDLVPVLSFLWLHGKCRNCQHAISWQYPLVEVGTVLALMCLYLHFGLSNQFWIAGLATLFLIPIFLTDLRYHVIPDRIVIPGIIIVVVVHIWFGADVLNIFMAMVVGAGFFLWQYILSRGRWIGAGDIGLGALMGAVLGWPNILIALALAYLAGALIGIGLMIFKKITVAGRLPFAPFLATATFITILYGEYIQRLLAQ